MGRVINSQRLNSTKRPHKQQPRKDATRFHDADVLWCLRRGAQSIFQHPQIARQQTTQFYIGLSHVCDGKDCISCDLVAIETSDFVLIK